jgi:glucose dehydrogenase
MALRKQIGLTTAAQLAWRYSALDQIKKSNVKSLTPVCAFQTGDYEMGLQSTPIVLDGVL